MKAYEDFLRDKVQVAETLGFEIDEREVNPLLKPFQRATVCWAVAGGRRAIFKALHLCPMQFDIADRAITQYSNPGDEVYDPFGGLMTVPYRAVLLGRRGRGCELSSGYFMDGATYCKAAADQVSMPSLLDLEEELAA